MIEGRKIGTKGCTPLERERILVERPLQLS